MDFFCVRKSRHARKKQHKRRTRKYEEQTSIIRFEARPRDNPTRNTERGRQTRRMSGAMANPFENQHLRDLRALEQAFPYHRPQTPRVPTRNLDRDGNQANPIVPQGRANIMAPQHQANPFVPQAQANPFVPQGQAQETPQQFNQVYVHPYSSHHYRFAVVNHSIICHGLGPSLHPVCSFALVPEFAAVRDIEGALAHRPELVTMARLKGTGQLVHMNTFNNIRALHEASLQLEVRDFDNNVDDAPTLRNRGDQ
ncbi:hypothetical protein F4782DRAFT_466487 [Xylaria castorea]|nr:hypothetical protein F4782DRAFT_466487 [Xylaria castorea]